jgi:type IV pilus assembly protein PilM
MASSNICWGVEIGGGAIKALKLEAGPDGPKVLDFAVVNHPKVLSTPELDQNDAIRVALGLLSQQVSLAGDRVAISLPGHQSFCRFAKLPPVEPKKVPDIVKFEAVQQIPFPLEEVEWDYQTFVSPDSPDVEVGIFAVTRQRIMERLALLEDVGIVPEVATISPVAAYNALAVDLGFTEKTPGTIILDIGTVATDLIIAEAGRVWVRTFPIGGHAFTEAVAQAFKLSYSKAEKLKREAEQTQHAKHVFQAMRPVFGDLAQEVQRSIGFYQSVHPDAKLERLVGLGSTFMLPGLRKFLKAQLGLDVYRMEQFKKLSVDGPRAGEFQAATLNLATAYGLALQGLEQASLRANLMPVQVVRASLWKKKTAWFAAAAGLAAAAGGAAVIRPLMDSAALRAAQPPAVLNQITRDSADLKSRADAAGVTAAGSSNLAAAGIVSVVSERGLMPRIVDDTAAMLASLGADASSVRVESIATRFNPGGEGGEGGDDFGGGGGGGDPFASGGGGDPWGQDAYGQDAYTDPRLAADPRLGGGAGSPSAPAESPTSALATELAGVRHVAVTIELETPLRRNDFDTLVQRTIEQWVKANAKRTGVPYTVRIDATQPWQYTDIASGPGGGGRPAPSGAPGLDPRLAADLAASDPSMGGRGASDWNAPVSGGFSGSSGGSVDQIAPLVDPPPPGAPPAGRVRLTWYAVLGGQAEGGDA